MITTRLHIRGGVVMTQIKQTAEDVRRHIMNNLRWRAATRHEQQVAQAIHQGEELDAI
jgi:hypothetical protein